MLREHLIEGLRDSTTKGEFRDKILLEDNLTFEAIKAKLCLKEQSYGETFEQAQCLAMRGIAMVILPM